MSVWLNGCATLYNPATGRNEIIFINSESEYAMGQSVKQEVFKQNRQSRENALVARVAYIGKKIALVSDRQDIGYSFDVLDNKELNAFAIPGGMIYINSGLAHILTDDELAFVLGHEAGHTAARHIVKKLQSNMAFQVLLSLAFAGAKPEASQTDTIAQGASVAYQLLSLSYSRKDEFDADKLGVKYALKAGFDPNASVRALEKIKGNEGPNWKLLGYFRTHPYVEERITALHKEIPILKNEKQ